SVRSAKRQLAQRASPPCHGRPCASGARKPWTATVERRTHGRPWLWPPEATRMHEHIVMDVRITPQAVRTQLGRILGSEAFVRCRRMQRFLEFIVEETLA